MSLQDVRDFLMKQIKELANSDATPEELEMILERAKATSQVAAVYIESVKAEIYAARLLADTGYLPSGMDAPKYERIPFDGKPQ